MPIQNREGALYFATGIDNSGLLQGRAEGMGILKGFGGMVSKLDIFAGLATGAVLAFKQIATAAYKMSKEFEHSMKEVQSISSEVTRDFDGFSQAIVNMSKGVPQSANELAKAYYEIVSSGYDGEKGLELLSAASKAAVAGVTDVTTAADGLTTILNSWNLSTSESVKVTDQLFEAVRLGKVTFGELAGGIAQVAPLAAAMDVSLEEVIGAMATLTKQGTQSEVAFTQIRQALIGLNENLGDGWSEVMTFQEALQKLRDMSGGSNTKLREMMGRVEGVLGVLAMTGDKAKMAAEDFKIVSGAYGSTATAFKIMVEDNINQTKILSNNIHAKLKPLGDFINKAVTDTAARMNESFKSTTDRFKELTDKYTDQEKAIKPLIERYEQLRGKTDLTNVEQDELRSIITQIAGIMPMAISSFDDYGNALDISAEKAKKFMERMKILLEWQNREAIKENQKALKKLKDDRDKIIKELAWVGGEPTSSPTGGLSQRGPAPSWWAATYTGAGLDERRADLQGLQDEIKKTEELIELLKGSYDEFEEGTEGTGGGGGGGEIVTFDIEAFQDNLEKVKAEYQAYEKLVQAGFEEEAKAQYGHLQEMGDNWMEYLADELEAYKDNIEARKILFLEFAEVTTKKIEAPVKTKPLDQGAAAKDIAGMLKPLQEAADKRALKLKIKIDAGDSKKDLENLYEILQGVSHAIDSATGFLGTFDGKIGDVSREFGQMAKGFTELFAGVATGDPLAALSGMFGFFSGLKGMMDAIFDKTDEQAEQLEEYHTKLNESIQRVNDSLERQKEILDELAKGDWLKKLPGFLDELDTKIAGVNSQLQQMYVSTAGRRPIQIIDVSGFNLDDWERLLENPERYNMDEEAIKILTDQWKLLLEQQQEYIDAQKEELTATMSDAIASSILDGFAEGEKGIEDFAGTFEDLMKQAILNSFKREFLEKQFRTWYDTFAKLSEGGLTQAEIAQLQLDFENIISGASQGLEALSQATGIYFDKAAEGTQGLAGAISRGITEDTASLLAGQFNAIRLDVKEQIAILYKSADYLFEIAENTRFNRRLETIDQNIAALKNQLSS